MSPLFHEGAQDIQLINLAILPRWLVVFSLRRRSWSRGGSFWRTSFGAMARDGGPNSRPNAHKSASHVLDRRSFADRDGSAPPVR
jgi:hypothetical protein